MQEHPASRPRRPPAGPGAVTAPTLHDVAREAGVSVATASRALNGSARSVRQENVSRVLAAAAKLDYRPHLSAQAIARGSTETAALVVSAVDDPYFSMIAAGVSRAAEDAGLILTMAVADRSPERELEIVRALRGRRPRAIVLAGSRIDDADTREHLIEELTAYRTAGGRVVAVTQPGLPFRTIAIDNAGGARQLAHAVVGLGYRRFAIVRAADRLRTSRDRHQGFVAGLRESGVGIDERFVIETEFSRDGGYRAVRELLHRGLAGTELVFAVTDVMAIGAMTACRDAGLVPGVDLAVAGFDDIDAATDVVPALTTVALPLDRIGFDALTLALGDDGEDVVRVPAAVVLRDSTPARPIAP